MAAADPKHRMHFTAGALWRTFTRTLIASFTASVLYLIQSVFWNNAVSPWMIALLCVTAALSFFRPHPSLLALVVLAPLGQAIASVTDSPTRVAEALVLAFLAGVLLRGWALHRFRSVPSDLLHVAAIAFSVIVAASCVEQLWFLQFQRDFPMNFLRSLAEGLGRAYLTTHISYTMAFHAMLFLEGMALLLYVRTQCRTTPSLAPQVLKALVIGATLAALINFTFVVSKSMTSGVTTTTFVDLLKNDRWSAHIADANAAGSFFAMAAIVAFGVGIAASRWRVVWMAAGLALALALWLTASRAAFAGVGLVAAFCWARAFVRHSTNMRRSLAITGIAALVFIVSAPYLLERNGTLAASESLGVRRLFLRTTGNMLRAEPLFGFGIGQFPLWSSRFAPPELLSLYPRENAHNNFAQVAGELGVLGLAAFVALLTVCVWPRRRDATATPLASAAMAAVAAFVISWMTGHPLLVPEVAFPFWIALAVVAAHRSDDRPLPANIVRAAAIASLVVFVSIPWRFDRKLTFLDIRHIRYGFSGRFEEPTGAVSWLAAGRARFFVPGEETRITLSLRGRTAAADTPLDVTIAVDDEVVERVRLDAPDWQTRTIPLSQHTRRDGHRIDLRTVEPDTLPTGEDTLPIQRRIDVREWVIISKPHG